MCRVEMCVGVVGCVLVLVLASGGVGVAGVVVGAVGSAVASFVVVVVCVCVSV